MELLNKKITIESLKEMARGRYGNMVKAVVDIRGNLMVVDAELHSDQEMLLLDSGSRQQDLWGINVYPDLERTDPDFIEFDSMINLRPAQGNFTRDVDDEAVRNAIKKVVYNWIE